MTTNLRCDDKFVQDEGWESALARYENFIARYKDKRILLLELGVGGKHPGNYQISVLSNCRKKTDKPYMLA